MMQRIPWKGLPMVKKTSQGRKSAIRYLINVFWGLMAQGPIGNPPLNAKSTTNQKKSRRVEADWT
jgi:hypothetical protein